MQCLQGAATLLRDLLFSRLAEQTMGMPALKPEALPQRRWTAAQVRELQDESLGFPRYELIGGELVVTPSPGHPHQLAAAEILFIVMQYIDNQQIGVALASPSDIELKPETIVQPDVYVVPTEDPPEGAEPRTWQDFKELLLAIEIISPSSVRNDRIVKRDFYLEAGVPEYWIVDLDSRMIERWAPDRQTPEVCRTSLAWHPEGARSPLTIDLTQLFETIWRKYRALPQWMRRTGHASA